jgi:hypothetical protein
MTGRLIALFQNAGLASRLLCRHAHAVSRPDVAAFVAWLATAAVSKSGGSGRQARQDGAGNRKAASRGTDADGQRGAPWHAAAGQWIVRFAHLVPPGARVLDVRWRRPLRAFLRIAWVQSAGSRS